MPRGSRALGSKRKRSWNTECPSFPGERPLQVRRAGLRTAGAAASLSEAWLRCGEGFQNTSGNPSLTAEEKTITEKHLELCPRPKQETTTSKSTSGLTDITWSSSGSDLSDEDKTLSQLQRDELQFIDWEIDSDRAEASDCNEFEDDEGAVEISDCASCASNQSLTSDEKLSELPKVENLVY
ncbi:SPIDR isoform 10 [Pan troglodytes]|uniref:SPIDR isoform 10 n=1 Tax=Pan troglodytes TaxID=9598 RepID=A0A2J8JMI6_PANTR|nr:SPIDR isoform 8 [Pan troglodytes]PNI23988.1 SPIDR isoform 10 [Pan troglodytes]